MTYIRNGRHRVIVRNAWQRRFLQVMCNDAVYVVQEVAKTKQAPEEPV